MGTIAKPGRRYRPERAVSSDGSTFWVVVDEEFELHFEACTYLSAMRGDGRAYNTLRTYAGRIGLYLTYCADRGIDWSRPSVNQLRTLLWWLVDEPLPSRSLRPTAVVRNRSKGTANAILGTTGEFLTWCSLQGWVPAKLISQLTVPRYLRMTPPGFDAGEDGRHRVVQTRTVKFKVDVPGYEFLTFEQIEVLAQGTTHARDRFLVWLLALTAMRIGEALGLRREDMHLLPDSSFLGCPVRGAHVHVRRRENSNNAYAKSPFSRWIPVEQEELIALYMDYCYERDAVAEAADCDMVFVNLFRAPLGEAMKYDSTYELFGRLAKKAGLRARPHIMRHSAITKMRRDGVDTDVIQDIAGHLSPSSMEPYSHATGEDKRAAVEKVGAIMRKARG